MMQNRAFRMHIETLIHKGSSSSTFVSNSAKTAAMCAFN